MRLCSWSCPTRTRLRPSGAWRLVCIPRVVPRSPADYFHRAREDRDNSAPRGAPVSNAQCRLSPDPTQEMAPSWASQSLVCAAMLANLRHINRCTLLSAWPARPQIILLKPLTGMTVETN